MALSGEVELSKSCASLMAPIFFRSLPAGIDYFFAIATELIKRTSFCHRFVTFPA